MDVETASNLTTNFLRYQQEYIDHRLIALRADDLNLSKDGVSELLCYLIDILPLDGREDLVALKSDIDVESERLQKL
jgi:hypothetical protein